MADNVEDGFGSILQRIQSELAAIRAKQEEHDGRFDRLESKVDDLELGVNQAVGIATRALQRSTEAVTAGTSVHRRLDDLSARVAALESR